MTTPRANNIGFGPLKGPEPEVNSGSGSGWVWSAIGLVVARGGSHRLYAERNTTFTSFRASVAEAPTGQGILVDIMRNNLTSILPAPLSIAVGAFTAVVVPSVAIVQGDFLTVNVTQIGTTFAGRSLTVQGT